MRFLIKNHPELTKYLFFTGIASFILFFISPDSYFNDMHTRCDSAWFFMCGKAWMNGLVPYVDFSDSKGPLLWLIYGIGYLISRTNYLGVFWISCFWYGLTYYFVFKTADIFLKDTRKSFVCSVLMSIAFFNPWFHNEIRAEDFSHLFMVLSLYELCLITWADTPYKNRSFLILGACFAALLLIKFNIAAMQAVIVLADLIVIIKNNDRFIIYVIYCLSGAILVILPFASYFAINNILGQFFQEYFIKTLSTVSGLYSEYSPNLLLRTQGRFADNPFITYLFEWASILYEPEIGAQFVFLLLGTIWWGQYQDKYRFLPLIISVCVFGIAIRHHISYYFTICAPFFIFLFIQLLSIPKRFNRVIHYLLSTLAIVSCIIFHILYYNYSILFFNNNKNQQDFYSIATLIHQVPHPTIINAGCGEYGFGITTNVLPSGKYWALQNGATEEMKREHKELALSGQADFVIVRWSSTLESAGLSYQDLENAGYKLIYQFGEDNNNRLYSNRTIDLTLTERAFTNWDRFQKKRR